MHIATTSKFAIIRCKLPRKNYEVFYAGCTRVPASRTEATPRASRHFPEGGRSPASRSEEGDRSPTVAARLTARRSSQWPPLPSPPRCSSLPGRIGFWDAPLSCPARVAWPLCAPWRVADYGHPGNRAQRRVGAGSTSRRPAPPPWALEASGKRGERRTYCKPVPLSLPDSSPSVPSLRPHDPAPAPLRSANEVFPRERRPDPLEGEYLQHTCLPACSPGSGATWDTG